MWISKFESSLVYMLDFRSARTAQRNAVSKNKKQKQLGCGMVHTREAERGRYL